MTAATALSISDIEISSQDAEPRIRDLSLAARLGMADPHKIRSLIEANRDELVTYGVISARQAEIRRRGRPGTEYWLNEGQLLVICALSRAPEAPAIRREIITVFLAHRHNQILAQHEALFAAPAPRVTTVKEHKRRVSTSRTTLDSNLTFERNNAIVRVELRTSTRRQAARAFCDAAIFTPGFCPGDPPLAGGRVIRLRPNNRACPCQVRTSRRQDGSSKPLLAVSRNRPQGG